MSSDPGEEGATRRYEEEETIAELSDTAALHTYLSACASAQELQDIYIDIQDDLHYACQAQAQYPEQEATCFRTGTADFLTTDDMHAFRHHSYEADAKEVSNSVRHGIFQPSAVFLQDFGFASWCLLLRAEPVYGLNAWPSMCSFLHAS